MCRDPNIQQGGVAGGSNPMRQSLVLSSSINRLISKGPCTTNNFCQGSAWPSHFRLTMLPEGFPDISVHLEKTEEASQKPLSPEAYTRFRKTLGRLLWMSQVRTDLKVWLSLLGRQQKQLNS